MSATTAPRVSGLRRHARGIAVGLALGLITDAFAALLNHDAGASRDVAAERIG
jgi:hypothetical protein